MLGWGKFSAVRLVSGPKPRIGSGSSTEKGRPLVSDEGGSCLDLLWPLGAGFQGSSGDADRRW